MSQANFKFYQTEKQFTCSSCGGEMKLINSRTQYVGCVYCGSLADVRSEANKVIMKMDEPAKCKPLSFVKLGTQGTLKNKKFQVIGRTRFGMDYMEYWKENGETGYEKTTWEYDEWLLMFADGTYGYLLEDKEGFKLSETIIPKFPSMPSGTSINDFHSGKPQLTNEYGSVYARYFEGESTYQVQINDRHDFWTYKILIYHNYSAEARYADQNSQEYSEISFYEETPIRNYDWIKIFEIDPAFQKFLKKKQGINTHRAIIRTMFGLITAACLVFWIKSFFGDVAFQQTLNMANFKTLTENDTFAILNAKTDLFELTGVQKVYGLSVLVEMPTNQDCGLEVEVLDNQGESVNLIAKEAYKSSGSDGGESWTENDNEFLEHYWLDSAGKYQLDLNLEIPKTFDKENYSVIVTVDQTFLSRYYIIGFLFFLILTIFTNQPKKTVL